MLAYSIIMFAVAILFLGLAAAIYRGNTNLIHDYHQTKIKESDKKAYGKAFSKGMLAIAVSLILSGAIALLGETTSLALISVGVLLVGLIISFIVIAKVQKKFNGGF